VTTPPKATADRSVVNVLRDRLVELVKQHALSGALITGADGFLIDANLPAGVAAEPLAALSSALGRQLEVISARVGSGGLETAYFSAADGTLFVGATQVGFVALIGDRNVNAVAVRKSLQETLRAVTTG
jgi:predicted regulator of Ras-like GTPase activity (Roadblock/LC7/MglB family)